METSEANRRTILRLGVAAITGATMSGRACAQTVVPWSTGTESPRFAAPAGATDCHHHIYDGRYKADSSATLKPGDATVADYRLLQRRLRTERNVIVQPSTYGVDNSLLVAALAECGASARGVAVVNTDVTDAELQLLHDHGVRGIRFNLVQTGATTPAMILPLATRVAPLGWHVQIHMLGDQIVGIADILGRLPCPAVFDHMARLPEPAGAAHPAFALVSGMAREGRAWVKLSGAYMDTKIGPPNYLDSAVLGASFTKLAPERMLWGSDWPHPTVTTGAKPDDAVLLDLLAAMVPEETTRARILVQNPETLYGFSAAS